MTAIRCRCNKEIEAGISTSFEFVMLFAKWADSLGGGAYASGNQGSLQLLPRHQLSLVQRMACGEG